MAVFLVWAEGVPVARGDFERVSLWFCRRTEETKAISHAASIAFIGFDNFESLSLCAKIMVNPGFMRRALASGLDEAQC